MKSIKIMLLGVLAFLGWAFIALAQTTNGVPVTPAVPLPSSLAEYWDLGISAVTPIIVWLATKFIPKIPKPLLAFSTPFVGILLGLGVNALSNANLTWVDMAKAGGLAVLIREVINQNITKRLVAETSTTPSK